MPHLKPVGHQSTNWMVRLVLMVATDALTSLGTTSPRYIRQHAMYLPWRGSHLRGARRGDQPAVQAMHPKSQQSSTQQAVPCVPRRAHLAIMEEGSNAELVISATDSCSWYAFSAEITGA